MVLVSSSLLQLWWRSFWLFTVRLNLRTSFFIIWTNFYEVIKLQTELKLQTSIGPLYCVFSNENMLKNKLIIFSALVYWDRLEMNNFQCSANSCDPTIVDQPIEGSRLKLKECFLVKIWPSNPNRVVLTDRFWVKNTSKCPVNIQVLKV